MHRMNGAQLVIGLLERQGIAVIPGIPGGANLPLYDALSRSARIRHVLARHEQGAGFMAQGMARTTGCPAVFFATSGPGAVNTLTALADAKLDSVPVICITGQVPVPMIGTDAFQEVDTYGMSLPVTKHNFLVRSAAELLHVIPEAFRIALSGRPGPVLVDIPKDVQTAPVEFPDWPTPGRADPSPAIDAAVLGRAADMINQARRPILCLGGGVVSGNAWEVARELAEHAGIPAAMTLMGLGAVPAGHPLCLGMLGMHGARHTNQALEECDLLLVAGARFDERATGLVHRFCPKARVVHIDVDASELGKVRRADAAIHGDVRDALAALLPLLEVDGRPEWNARIGLLKRLAPVVFPDGRDPRSAYGVILHAAEQLGEGAVVVTDVGQHQMRVAQAHPLLRPRRWLTSGGLGTMGFGLPAAIGACLALPGATAVLFTGDGSILMNIQELATAVEEDANIKIVLTDNRALGLVQQQQDLFYGRRLFGSSFRNQVDFAQVARGFGMPALDLGASRAPRDDLALALGSPGPCLVHVPLPGVEHVYPMVPPGAANHEMIGGESHARALS